MVTNHKTVQPPNANDKYYINQSYGGLSLNVPKNNKGYTLPNCVALANAEFSRECNRFDGVEEMFRYFIYDAVNFWWQVTEGHYKGLFETGQEAREGAIMVWSGGAAGLGHVAICDYVDDDKKEYVESTASGIIFNRQKFNDTGRRGMNSSYKFLGYIYNPHIKQLLPVNPVKRDFLENQVEVTTSTLRVRTAPNLKGRVYGFAKKGIYNASESGAADGYEWYKIADGQYIADVKLKHLLQKGDKVRIKEGAKTFGGGGGKLLNEWYQVVWDVTYKIPNFDDLYVLEYERYSVVVIGEDVERVNNE